MYCCGESRGGLEHTVTMTIKTAANQLTYSVTQRNRQLTTPAAGAAGAAAAAAATTTTTTTTTTTVTATATRHAYVKHVEEYVELDDGLSTYDVVHH